MMIGALLSDAAAALQWCELVLMTVGRQSARLLVVNLQLYSNGPRYARVKAQ